MWIWIFGLSISIFLILNELQVGIVVSLIPLLFLNVASLIELVFYSIHTYPSRVKLPDIIESTFIWSITLSTTILLYLQLTNNISFDLFYTLVLLVTSTISIIYIIVGGYFQLFINMSWNVKVANILTLITTITTYLTFYGVEYGSIVRWVPLVPFLASIAVEAYCVYMTYVGTTHLKDDFSKQLAKNRTIYSICVGILFFVSVLHYAFDGVDIIIYICSTLLYAIGIFILLLDDKSRICTRLRCFKQAKWQQLKNEQDLFDTKKDSVL